MASEEAQLRLANPKDDLLVGSTIVQEDQGFHLEGQEVEKAGQEDHHRDCYLGFPFRAAFYLETCRLDNVLHCYFLLESLHLEVLPLEVILREVHHPGAFHHLGVTNMDS